MYRHDVEFSDDNVMMQFRNALTSPDPSDPGAPNVSVNILGNTEVFDKASVEKALKFLGSLRQHEHANRNYLDLNQA